MKKKISTFLIGILFLAGLGILLYPTISNQWNTYRQSRLISNYETVMKDMEPEDYTEEWEKAKAFNDKLTENNIYGDVFSEGEKDLTGTEYWKVLNIAGDGIMGYLSIPKINVKLAIYHGSGEKVLETGVGHLDGTKLPIGGESTHSVLSAHRGLPSARLFTDIDQLELGDKFYVHVLDQILAYEVNQVLPMVDKDDQDALTEALKIEQGQDQVTLFTCTPYGVNSHRLLVRGKRVAYTGEETEEDSLSNSMLKAIKNYYMLYLILGLSVTLLIIIFIRFLFKHNKKGKKRKKRKKRNRKP